MTITVKLPCDQKVVLDKDHIVVGRDPDCDVMLSDEQRVQPHHAIIKKVAGRWLVQSEGDWLLQVGSSVPSRMCWIKTNDVIRLTEAGPDIVFVQGDLRNALHQQSSNGEPPAALGEPVVSADDRILHRSDGGAGLACSSTTSPVSAETSRTLVLGSPSSNLQDQPCQSPLTLPSPISAAQPQQPLPKRRAARWVFPACWLGVLVIAVGAFWFTKEWDKTQKIRFAEEFGGELWGKGAKDQAVEQYRPILSILPSDDQAAVVYQRVIEYDLEKGKRESAKLLMQQALKRGVIMEFDSRAAATMLAEVKSNSTEEVDDEDTETRPAIASSKQRAGVSTKSTSVSGRSGKREKHGNEVANHSPDAESSPSVEISDGDILSAEHYPAPPGRRVLYWFKTGLFSDDSSDAVYFLRREDCEMDGVFKGTVLRMFSKDHDTLYEVSGPMAKTLVGRTTTRQRRIHGQFVEVKTQMDTPEDESFEPIIKVGAKPGESWNLERKGFATRFTYLGRSRYRGEMASVVECRAFMDGKPLSVRSSYYVKGKGLVYEKNELPGTTKIPNTEWQTTSAETPDEPDNISPGDSPR